MPRISCKVCRRAGESLCGREKCAQKKRPYKPGILDSERKNKSGFSEYGFQLGEKRKVRESYGLREKQFAKYVESAMQRKGSNTVEEIFQALETRLDNVVYRAGLAHTRALARQLVSHGHILVNGKKVDIPSFQVKVDDVVEVRAGSKSSKYFIQKLEDFSPVTPSWITYTQKDGNFKIKSIPKEIDKNFNFQAIVEFYSR